jgi:hypothetical protein
MPVELPIVPEAATFVACSPIRDPNANRAARHDVHTWRPRRKSPAVPPPAPELTICKNKALRPFSQSWPAFPILSRKFFRRNMQRRQNDEWRKPPPRGRVTVKTRTLGSRQLCDASPGAARDSSSALLSIIAAPPSKPAPNLSKPGQASPA